jgi:hypothetical protein
VIIAQAQTFTRDGQQAGRVAARLAAPSSRSSSPRTAEVNL